MSENGSHRHASSPATPVVWSEATEALPGLARIAATAWLRSAAWTLDSGVRSTRLMLRARTDREVAEELVQGVARDVAEATRTVSEVARAISAGVPIPKAVRDATLSLSEIVMSPEPHSHAEDSAQSLRQRGEELLERSRDVWSDEHGHPAYSRILEELAPDEARILLLLLRGGPQPSVDVRTGGPVGLVSSALIAPGMSMIGARAGCRYLDQVPAYLNNLFRLGLIWFSREQLEDPMEYQVVEAQPDVLEAMHSVRFAKVVRRSIHLTPFGVGFCRACLVDDAEAAELPTHQIPEE